MYWGRMLWAWCGAVVVGSARLPRAHQVLVDASGRRRQEQLQRKHEELQQMIVRQQEELRRVKEQLLLARLGILQPLMNVPNTYASPEEMQQNQRIPAQILYDATQGRGAPGYQEQNPPPSAGHDQNMPQ